MPAHRPCCVPSLLVACAALAGCAGTQGGLRAPRPPGLPMTASEIARRYGPLAGSAAELVASGRADASLRGGALRTRSYTRGRGRDAVEVTEHLVLGEPYRIEVRRRRYFDPLEGVPDERIASVAYGTAGNELLRIGRGDDMAALLAAVRGESYEDVREWAFRRVEGGRPTGGGGGSKPSLLGHGCSLGLYVHLADGTVVHLSGHPSAGEFARADGGAAFRNGVIHGILRDIAKRRRATVTAW